MPFLQEAYVQGKEKELETNISSLMSALTGIGQLFDR
jgi:hypothetical protein